MRPSLRYVHARSTHTVRCAVWATLFACVLACGGVCVQVGVTEVVLAVSYKPEVMLGALADMEVKYGVKLTCSQEVEPMGTGTCARVPRV